MTSTQRAAMEQALEWIEAQREPRMNGATKATAALRAALAEQPAEQAPVNIGPEWAPCVKLPVTVYVRQQRPGETHVSTREGITPVKPDDLIMRGVSGEEYPIGREIFERTYQLGAAPHIKAEQPAEQEPVAQRWQPIETAPKGRIVLVYYKNSLGNGRTMRARYYLPETLDSDTTESGWAEEGWYEESEAYEYLMPLEHQPTHWMPLPAGPDTAPQPKAEQPAEPVAVARPDPNCPTCHGTGVDGDCADDGSTIDVDCGCLKHLAPMPKPPWDGTYKDKCEDGKRCLQGCRSSERCYWVRKAPEVPQPAKRVPLTDEQIEKIKAKPECWEHVGQRIEFRYRPFARAIEAAHGITGEPT